MTRPIANIDYVGFVRAARKHGWKERKIREILGTVLEPKHVEMVMEFA